MLFKLAEQTDSANIISNQKDSRFGRAGIYRLYRSGDLSSARGLFFSVDQEYANSYGTGTSKEYLVKISKPLFINESSPISALSSAYEKLFHSNLPELDSLDARSLLAKWMKEANPTLVLRKKSRKLSPYNKEVWYEIDGYTYNSNDFWRECDKRNIVQAEKLGYDAIILNISEFGSAEIQIPVSKFNQMVVE